YIIRIENAGVREDGARLMEKDGSIEPDHRKGISLNLMCKPLLRSCAVLTLHGGAAPELGGCCAWLGILGGGGGPSNPETTPH
ncbi:unnamed protein product, partial [Urochloa humidicola]